MEKARRKRLTTGGLMTATGDERVSRQASERQDYKQDNMGRMSADRVVCLWRAGFSVVKIRERLLEEGIVVSRKSLYLLLKSTMRLTP